MVVTEKESFIEYLTQSAHSYGFTEPKLSYWIKYMSDIEGSRFLLKWVLKETLGEPAARDSCLDVGCGFGNLVLALSEHFNDVAGIELMADRCDWCRKRCDAADINCGTAESLPWPSNRFSLVTSTDVFEHIDFDQQVAAAREIARVIKPGGWGFVTVPSKLQLHDEHNFIWFGTWMPDSMRKYFSEKFRGQYVQCWERTASGWARLFRDAGLKVKITPVRNRKNFYVASRCNIFLRKPAS